MLNQLYIYLCIIFYNNKTYLIGTVSVSCSHTLPLDIGFLGGLELMLIKKQRCKVKLSKDAKEKCFQINFLMGPNNIKWRKDCFTSSSQFSSYGEHSHWYSKCRIWEKVSHKKVPKFEIWKRKGLGCMLWKSASWVNRVLKSSHSLARRWRNNFYHKKPQCIHDISRELVYALAWNRVWYKAYLGLTVNFTN